MLVNSTLVSLILLALPSPALARSGVGLAYQAPDGCPAQPEFVAEVVARGADFDRVAGAESKRVMVVAIRKDEGGFAGVFQVRDDQTATSKREVHGPRCAEVVEALAVVTAIALRPEVAVATAPTADATPPVTPLPAPAADTKPPAPPADGARLRGNTQIFPPRTEKMEVGAGTLRFDLQRSYTLEAGATVGLVPSVVMPRYDLSALAANFVTTPEGAQRITGLVFELHVSLLGPSTYQSADTKTDMIGFSFAMGLCQSPLYDTRGLVLLFCGEYGGGFMNLVTKGADGTQIQSKNAGFGTVSLWTGIQYNLGSVFHVGAKVGGGFNVGQLTAERADGSRIFASSVWSAYGLLGLGVHF
jgi:hypothetical protein